MNQERIWSRRGAAYAGSDTHRASGTLDRLLALLRPVPSDRCLDLGSGAGHTAARLAEIAAEVVALDPAPGMLAAARDLYGDRDNLRFVVGSGADSGLPAGGFDLIAARHTLHHHPDPQATLHEVARLLRPGGRFGLIDEITPSPRLETWYHALEVARDPAHIRAYTLETWRSMIETSPLTWVVGDGLSSEQIEVDSWLARLERPAEAESEVRRLLRTADGAARALFGIRYGSDGEASHFVMPVAAILAVKEER